MLAWFPSYTFVESTVEYQINVDIINENMNIVTIEDVNEVDVCSFNTINVELIDTNNSIVSFSWLDSDNNLVTTDNLLTINDCLSDFYILSIEGNSNSSIVDTFRINCNSIDITLDTIYSLPNYDFLSLDQNDIYDLCIGEEFTLNILNNNPNHILQHQWVASSDFISSGANTSNPTFGPSKEGVFSVLLLTYNQFGCSRRDQLNFSVHAITNLQIHVTLEDQDDNIITSVTPDSIFSNCLEYSKFTLSSTASSNTGDVLIEWRNGSNELIGNQPSIAIEPTQNDIYSVTFTDLFGCYSTKFVQIIGEPTNYSLTNSISSLQIENLDDDDDLDLCLSFSEPILAVEVNSEDSISYLWSGNIIAGNHSTSSPILFPPAPGSYKVHLKITNQYGCNQEFELDLFFFDEDSDQTILYSQECGSNVVNFEAPNTDFNFYSWVFIDANNNNHRIDEQSTSFDYNEIGQYIVQLMPRGDNNCDLPVISQVVNVHESLPVPILSVDYLECKSDTLIVQFSTSDMAFSENINYEWQFSDDNSSFADSPILKLTEPGNFQANLVLKDSYDCLVSDSIIIDVELLNVDFLQDSIFTCDNQNIIELNQDGSLDLSYNWMANDYFTDLNQSNPIVSPQESTSFEVSISKNFNNYRCESTQQIEVFVASEINSSVEIQGVAQSSLLANEDSISVFLCNSSLSPFKLIAPYTENAIYYWYSSENFSSETIINQNQFLEINPSTSTIDSIFLQVKIEDCLSSIFVVNLNFESAPEMNISSTYTKSSGCGPGVLQLFSEAQSNSSSIVYYSWEGPNGFVSTLPSPTIFVNDESDNGEYTLTVFTMGGCVASTSLMVNEITPALLPNPTIELIGNQCEGSELTLSVNQQYSDNAIYFWDSPTNVSLSGQQTQQLTISSFNEDEHFGRYTLQVVIDTCISLVDTFLLAPTAQITLPSTELCQGSNIQLSLFSSEGVSFSWSGPNNFFSTDKSPWLNNVSEINNGLYTVEIQNASGCITTLTTMLHNILPDSTKGDISVSGPICQGDDIVLSIDKPGQKFEWIGPLGLTLESQNITELLTNEPTTKILSSSVAYLPGDWKVIVTDDYGCTSISNPVPVNIIEESVAEIQGDDFVCAGQTLRMFALTVEGAEYEWFLQDNIGNLNSASNSQAFEIPNISAGLYSISLKVSKDNCPSELKSKSFLIPNRPTASPEFSFISTSDCNVYDVLLSSNSNDSDSNTYLWTGPNGFVSNESNPLIKDVSSSDFGTYFIEIIDSNNCSSIDYAVEIFEIPQPIETPIITQIGSNCEGNTIKLAISEVSNPEATYAWYGPNGLIEDNFTSIDTLIISSFNANDAGEYRVSMTLNNCTLSSDNFELSIFPLPEISVNSPSVSLCQGDTLLLESNVANAESFQWIGPNGFSSNQENIAIENINYTNNGVYSILATSSFGCSSEASIDVNFIGEQMVNPQIITSDICRGESLVLSTEFIGSTYTWISPLGEQINSPQFAPLVTAENFIVIESDDSYYLDGFWKVTVIDENGCELTSEAVNTSIHDNSIASINYDDILCFGDDIILSTDAEGYNYEWIFEPNNSNLSPIVLNTDTNLVIVLSQDEAYLEGAWSLNVTSDFGCFTPSSTAFIRFVDTPKLTPSNEGPYCKGEKTIQLLTNSIPFATYTWYQGNPTNNGFIVSNEQNPSIEIESNTDTISFFLVVERSGCVSQPAITEVVFSEQLAVNLQSAVSLLDDCSVGELQLFSNAIGFGPFTYNWSGPNSFSSSDANPIIVNDGAGNLNGVYTLQIFDKNDCVLSSSTNISMEEGINAPFINAGETQLCAGEPFTLSASLFSGDNVSYIWKGPLGSSLNGVYSSSEVLSLTEVGTEDTGWYSVCVIADGCTSESSDSITLEIIDIPEIETSNNINLCFDTTTSIALPLTVISGQGPLSFNWIGPGQFHSDNQNPVLADLNEGLGGIYSVIATDVLGCSSDTIQLSLDLIESPQTPIISSTSFQGLCEGDEMILTISNYDPDQDFYTWTFENGNTIQQNDSVLIINQLQIDEYDGLISVSSTKANCISSTYNAMISINPYPEILGISNSAETTPACHDDSVQLIAPEIPGAIYSWTGPNNFVSDTKDVTLQNVTTQDNGEYTLIVDLNGCSSNPFSTEVNIENQLTTPVIDPIHIACEGTDLFLNLINPDSSLTYEWFNLATNQSIGMGNRLELQSIALSQAGTYYVVASSQFCKSETVDFMISVTPKPVILGISNSTEPSPACYNDSIQLIGPEILGAVYSWTGPNKFNSNSKDVVLQDVTIQDAGVYTLMVEIDGCLSDPFLTNVNVEDRLPIPAINPIDTVCEGTDILFNLINADSSLTYDWFKLETNQLVGVGSAIELQNIGVDAAGSYYVVASSQFCRSEASALITVDVVSLHESSAFAGLDATVCQPDFLLGQDTSQQMKGLWSHTGDTSATILNPEDYASHVVDLSEGTNAFIWTVEEGNCMVNNMDTVYITYILPPVAVDDNYILDVNTEIRGDITLNDILITSDFAVSQISPATMGNFDLIDKGFSLYKPDEGFIGIDSIEYLVCYDLCPNDCDKATAFFKVGEENECFVPSVFTPNGDGINDNFDIPFLSVYPQSKLYIYNRWGDEVYFSGDYRGEWQGTYQEKTLPAGTYYYILEVNDIEESVKLGYVFLQR